METAVEDDRLNLGQFMQTYVLNPGCPLTPLQGQSLPSVDVGLPVVVEQGLDKLNSSSTVDIIDTAESNLGVDDSFELVGDQKSRLYELAENTPKAYIGSNLRYAREIKDPASLPRHIRERKWLLKNFLYLPGSESYHRVNAERVKEVMNERFPDHATHLVTRIMKLAFPTCRKIILKNGHYFLGLKEKGHDETWKPEKRKRGRKRGRKPKHVVRRIKVAGSDSEILEKCGRDYNDVHRRPQSTNHIGQPVVTLERDTTPEPDGLVQGHMSLDDLNAAGGSSEKSSSGSNEVLIPKNINGPEVILQSPKVFPVTDPLSQLSVSTSSVKQTHYHTSPKMTVPAGKVLVASPSGTIQVCDPKTQENLHIINVKAEPEDCGYESQIAVNLHSKNSSVTVSTEPKFTTNATIPVVPVFSTFEAPQFRPNSFCNNCAENMTVIESFKAEIDLLKEIIHRKDEQIVHLQGLLEQKKREATHYVNRVVEHSIPVNNIAADFIHLASRIFDATQKLRSAINEPVYTLPQQPPPR